MSAEPTGASPSSDLRGRHVVVVGGKVGMGLGVARAAKDAGAKVTVASRRDVSLSDRPDLAGFEQLRLDVGDETAVRNAFGAVGALDHLFVASAPDIGSWGGFMDPDLAGVRSYLEGKFLGSWACARYAAPNLPADGSITFLTGGIGQRPKLGFAAVSSAFAAVEALGRSLALELAPIRVNTLRPGFVDTDMWSFLPAAERDGLREKVRNTFPARRAGTIDDIGHAALFLMTNPYVTGTVVDVAGGELLVDAV